MHAAKRTKTRPSTFPSSLRTSNAHSSPPLPVVSRRFCAAAQLVLYRTSTTPPPPHQKQVRVWRVLIAASHFVGLMTPLTTPTYPFLHSPSFNLALRSMRALATLTSPRVRRWPYLSGAPFPYAPHAAYGHSPLCVLRPVPRSPPADRPPRPPKLRRRAARRR